MAPFFLDHPVQICSNLPSKVFHYFICIDIFACAFNLPLLLFVILICVVYFGPNINSVTENNILFNNILYRPLGGAERKMLIVVK